jgi:hypothetical protein
LFKRLLMPPHEEVALTSAAEATIDSTAEAVARAHWCCVWRPMTRSTVDWSILVRIVSRAIAATSPRRGDAAILSLLLLFTALSCRGPAGEAAAAWAEPDGTRKEASVCELGCVGGAVAARIAAAVTDVCSAGELGSSRTSR